MKIQVIKNPRSRRSIDNKELRQKLNGFDYSVVETTGPGEATAIAKEAVTESVTTVIVIGGDGTVNEAINGMLGGNARLAIIPAGGANDLATYLGIPRDVDAALDIAIGRACRSIDLIKVNGRCLATVGGLGFGSNVALKTNAFKSGKKSGELVYRLLGSNIYTAYAIFEIVFGREYAGHFRLRGNGFEHDAKMWNLLIANQPCLGKNFRITPGAANDDGWLDICTIGEPNGKTKQFSILTAVMKGKHVEHPQVTIRKTKRVTIECEEEVSFFGDGERIAHDSFFDIEVVHKAIDVVVPERSAR